MSKNLLVVSFSPHSFSKDSVSKVMFAVVIAMLPAFFWGIYVFGLGALNITIAAVLSC